MSAVRCRCRCAPLAGHSSLNAQEDRMSRAWQLAILLCVVLLPISATAADANYKQFKIQDLLGASWPEFAAELDSLLSNPKNEDAFFRMYKIAQRSDAESKVPQYLLKLSQDHPEKPQIKTLLGLFYRENRDYAQAIKYFREALEKSPDDYFVHYQLAHLMGKQDGEAPLKESFEHFKIAAERIGSSDVDLKSKMLEEWGELIMTRAGDAADARAAARDTASKVWDRLIADERKFDRLTYERLAQIYERYEMWDKAIATLRLCVENTVKEDNAARVRILDRIGDLSDRNNDYKAAAAAYGDALSLVDENHWLHKQLIVKLSKTHKKLGDLETYLKDLDKDVQDRAQSTAPMRDVALAHESLDEIPATIAALEQARNVAPRDITLVSDLLLLYGKMTSPEAAAKREALYRKLIEIMPENFDAYVGLADTCWAMGDAAKTQDALALLQNTSSKLPEKYLVMARAFKKYGMKGNARNAFEHALAEEPDNTDAAMELCDFCLDSAGTDDSTGAEPLQRANELRAALMSRNSLDESGYLRLMQVFQNHKRFDEARDIIGYAATVVFPKSFLCRYAFAELHYSRKEFYKAIQHYVAAMDLAPSFYFKRLVNDRIVTLTYNYGRREKDFMSEPTEDEKKKGLLGGSKGEGLAPWIFYLQALISNDPGNADNMMLLAQINENMVVDAQVAGVPIKTDAGRAKALYKSVVDMDLKNLDAHTALARTLVMTDEFEGAIQENWILEELSPVGKWQYVMNVGDLWGFGGYGDKALQNWNTVREQATSEPNLVYQLGSRMYQLGKLKDSIELVRKAATANRGEFRFHSTLGNLLDQSGEADPTQYVEATTEFRTAVELASQNPVLAGYLKPVLRRLLDVQVNLARTHFDEGKFAESAQTCADGLATLEKLKNPSLAETGADLACLRARALIAGGNAKEGEPLLLETLAAHPNALFWYDNVLRMSGSKLQELFKEGKLAQTSVAPFKETAAFGLAPIKTLAMPATIESVQGGTQTIYLESGSTVYKLAGEQLSLDPLKLPSAHGPISWLTGDAAVLPDDLSFSLINLSNLSTVWKKELSLNAVFDSDSMLACFHTRKSLADAQKQPAPAAKSYLTLIDRKSGRELWDIEMPQGELAFGDGLVLVKNSIELSALRISDGAVAWKTPISRDALWRRPIVAGDCVLMCNDMSNEIVAYGVKDGVVKFERSLGASLLCDPIVVSKDRAIFHVLRKRTAMLECLDITTGRLAWESGLQEIVKKKVNVESEPSAGNILREFWTDIPGTAVTDLTSNPKFTQAPNGSDYITKFEAPQNWGDNYGQRVRGFVIPPATGDYTFFVTSDDSSELWLSTDKTVESKQKICGVPAYTAPNEWAKYPEQKSQPIHLEAGKRYYIEALHKEGGGGDHISAGWTLPDGKQELPIPGNRLAPPTGAPPVEVPLDSLQGISLQPVVWNGWLLHLDPSRHRIWAARMDTGDVAPPIDLSGVCEPKLFDEVTGWGVFGDTLYLAARTGRVALAKFVK
jgi:tetratricopeptide (TPR) repeat protein